MSQFARLDVKHCITIFWKISVKTTSSVKSLLYNWFHEINFKWYKNFLNSTLCGDGERVSERLQSLEMINWPKKFVKTKCRQIAVIREMISRNIFPCSYAPRLRDSPHSIFRCYDFIQNRRASPTPGDRGFESGRSDSVCSFQILQNWFHVKSEWLKKL